MTTYAYPLLYAAFIWWFSTGLILHLDGLPRRTHPWSMAGATVVLLLALGGLAASRDSTSVAGAYCTFTCAVLIWGWQEVGFLLGYITGPNKAPCPPGTTGWHRFRLASAAVLYHEAALLATGAAVIAVSWGAANQVGTWTYLILWVMRLSAKLNMFLGVRNLYEDFLPEQLKYMQTYFARRPANLLWPVAVAAAGFAATLIWSQALAPGVDAFNAAGLTFAGMLLSLAILEHVFLILPLPSQNLWAWAMRSRHDIPPNPLPVAPLAEPFRQ
jgi:putative photosynthetic complex assembly protein 2